MNADEKGKLVEIFLRYGIKGGLENVVNKLAQQLLKRGFRVRIVQLLNAGADWVDDGIENHCLTEGVVCKDVSFNEYVRLYADFLETHGKPDLILATQAPAMSFLVKLALGISVKNRADASVFHTLVVPQAAQHSLMAVGKTPSCFSNSGSSGKNACGMGIMANEGDTGDCGVKVASWIHGNLEDYEKNGLGGLEYLVQADCHFVINKRTMRLIKGINPAARVDYVGNPVKMKGVVPVTEWNKSARRLLFVGRVVIEEKSPDVIIRALAKTNGRWDLTVVGDGPDVPALKALATDLGVSDRIQWNGWKENPWESYDDVTALVLASKSEGFALVAAESMARGIPVISTPVDGLVDYLKPGVNGYLFEKGSSDGLAEILDAIDAGILPDILPGACVESVAMFEEEAMLDNFVDKIAQVM